MTNRDWGAIALLIVLWGMFFWRLYTPIEADRASLTQGDFSGQFVTFGAYQHERARALEIPLWNPYNNGGLPFIADTQAAAFYPPRLLTLAFTREWTYHALQAEMTLHVLLYTLSMYALVRRMTGTALGGFVAAVVGGYGGYMSGYPPLQLALMEAGVWLPLALLGVHEATRDDAVNYRPLTLTGLALGCSWLAGHPQTSWFLTYLLVAYYAYRLWNAPARLWHFIAGTALFGLISFGATAVTFLPGLEYLARTARAGLGYAAKGNGFPFHDVMQMFFPGTVSLFSPLYVGVVGLMLAVAGARVRESRFWVGVAFFALLLSFGANAALFPALYNVVPGLRFFRGQERAAYLFAHSLAILAAYGAANFPRSPVFRVRVMALAGGIIAIFVFVFVLWLGFPSAYGDAVGPVAFSALTAGAMGLCMWRGWRFALMAVLVIELFSVNMDAPSNYDDIPPALQISMVPPPLIEPVVGARVDGFRGLTDNFGSLYGVYDVRGISPLFLDGLFQLQQPPFAEPSAFEINPVYWELMAVEYVFSGWDALPVPSQVIATGGDRFGPVSLHQLDDPRPFAHLVHRADVVDSAAFARALLADPAFDPRDSVILMQEPSLEAGGELPTVSRLSVTLREPERVEVDVLTNTPAIVTLAQPFYPGWRARLNGQRVDLLWAYSGLTAVEVPPGDHTLVLRYRPTSFIIGAMISLVTWSALGILGARALFWRRTHASE